MLKNDLLGAYVLMFGFWAGLVLTTFVINELKESKKFKLMNFTMKVWVAMLIGFVGATTNVLIVML